MLGERSLLYVCLFPVNIWILEVVEEFIIKLIWGRNVAWCYCDYADEYLSGCTMRIGPDVPLSIGMAPSYICVFLESVGTKKQRRHSLTFSRIVTLGHEQTVQLQLVF